MKTISTFHLEIVCKIMHHSEIIFKCVIVPEDTRHVDLQAWIN